MIQKRWFSVETLADGSIGKVCEVEAKGRNGSVVRFYEAVDKADACSQAKSWHEADKARRRSAYSDRVSANPGACTLHPRHPKKCPKCKEQRRRIKTGECAKRRTEVSAEELLKAKKIRDRISAEARTWVSLLSRFDALGPVAFRAWLVSRIRPMVVPEAQAAE